MGKSRSLDAAISLPTSYLMENSYKTTHSTQTVRHFGATKHSSGVGVTAAGVRRGRAMTPGLSAVCDVIT
ncbi:MAG: hypothetical protein ACHP65_05615, partial [Legionellales bacterium]